MPVLSITSLLKLGDYLSVQGHKPCYISHFKRPEEAVQTKRQFIDLSHTVL